MKYNIINFKIIKYNDNDIYIYILNYYNKI